MTEDFFTGADFGDFSGNFTVAVIANAKVKPLLKELEKLKRFCLGRCNCKSIPGAMACSYYDVVYGGLNADD